MRICLITPGHLATNPRLVKEADALNEAGHQVTVVAADYLTWAREADKEFAARPWRIAAPTRFGPDAPRLRRIVQLVRRRSARLLFRQGFRHQAVLRTAYHPAGPDLVRAALRVPADLYVAHYVAALPAAALAAKRWAARYAFDAEDFHLGDAESTPRFDEDRRLIRAMEGAWLPGCAYMTAASPGISDAYAETYGVARPTVVLNVFPRAQAPAQATLRGSSAQSPSAYWFSQTIGPNRGLEVAVRAISMAASRPHLFLRGRPASGFARDLETLAHACGVGDRLHLMGPAPPGEMTRLARQYDIGLAAEDGHTENRRVALTNKLFTYLLAGVPIVASDVPAHRRIAPELGDAVRLYSAQSAQSLADALDSYLMPNGALAGARATAFRLGQERFNWDLEKQTLIACVDRTAEARTRP